MTDKKRRKAMGSDPLADAAPAASAGSVDEHPDAPTGSLATDDLPQPVDVHVPPAPSLVRVPRKGALDPNDRVRTLIVGLMLVLMLAVGLQQLNRTAELRDTLRETAGKLNEADDTLAHAQARADALEADLKATTARLESAELLVAESEAITRLLDEAVVELSRATVSAGQWSQLSSALSAVRADLGFAWRWPQDRWPQVLMELDSGNTSKLGRPARPAELAALRGELRPETLQALADASDGLRSWARLGEDDRPESFRSNPDRGLLLLLLLDAGLAASELAVVPFESAYLQGQDLGAADLTGVDLNRADLRGTNLSRAQLTGTILKGAIYDGATRWPAGFNPPAAGAVLAGAPDEAAAE